MESVENETFEKIYPAQGCVFGVLGALMVGLIFIIILASMDKFQWECIPIGIFLACVAYFCFSRCFPRMALGVCAAHLTLDNKECPWEDIKHITFHKYSNAYSIQVEFNKQKYTRFSMLVLAVAIIVGVLLVISAFRIQRPGVGKVSGVIVMLPLLFGINIFKPRSRQVGIESKDFETVFRLTTHYADLYHIPLEYKEEKRVFTGVNRKI